MYFLGAKQLIYTNKHNETHPILNWNARENGVCRIYEVMLIAADYP